MSGIIKRLCPAGHSDDQKATQQFRIGFVLFCVIPFCVFDCLCLFSAPRNHWGDKPLPKPVNAKAKVSGLENPDWIKAKCKIPKEQRCAVENPLRSYATGPYGTKSEYKDKNPKPAFTEYIPGRDCMFADTTIHSFRDEYNILYTYETPDTPGNLPAAFQKKPPGEQPRKPWLHSGFIFAPSVLCSQDAWPAQDGNWRNMATVQTEAINRLVANANVERQYKDPYSSTESQYKERQIKRYM